MAFNIERNAHDMTDKIMGLLNGGYLRDFSVTYNDDDTGTIHITDDDGTQFVVIVKKVHA